MQCPVDSTDLLMAERHGVEIDYCPKCRGIWLATAANWTRSSSKPMAVRASASARTTTTKRSAGAAVEEDGAG